MTNRTESMIGKVSRQHAVNNDTFDAMKIGQKFDVCNWHNFTLHAVCIKKSEDSYFDVGDGREWKIWQSDIASRCHYFSWT